MEQKFLETSAQANVPEINEKEDMVAKINVEKIVDNNVESDPLLKPEGKQHTNNILRH